MWYLNPQTSISMTEDYMGDTINHILMNDPTVKMYVEDYMRGDLDSLSCYDSIYYRVNYMYSFKARESQGIYNLRVAELTHYFLMGVQDSQVNKLSSQIKRYQIWCQFCMLPLMVLILWMLYGKI